MKNSKWNDKRKTDAFKSTRKNNSFQKEKNIRPTNTRIWKKTIKNSPKSENTNNVFEKRKWSRDSSDTDKNKNNAFSINKMNKNSYGNTGSIPLEINSKWTAKREKSVDTNNVFSTQNTVIKKVPEKKSFNKKVVIIEIKTKKQIEAEKKAIYDSFIKESFILKLEDTLGKNKTVYADKEAEKVTDSWNYWDNENNAFDYTEHLTEFDKWEKDFLEYVDGESDDYDIVNKRRKQFFSVRFKDLYEHYKLPDKDLSVYNFSYDKAYADTQHKLMLINQLRRLSVLPTMMVEDTRENIDEVYDSLYEFMLSKRMRVGDISFEYDIENISDIDTKTLRKEFYKLRKKYNSIKKIQKKINNKEKVHKNEQEKYDSRHECIFLYHRLKYYDEYYLDSKLNFKNNTK
jgi:hypothetical protein